MSFLLAAAFVLYVVIGYPLLLAVLARRERRPVRKRFTERTVSILLPVRNGEKWIARKLESIGELEYPRQLVQVIVVLDGSEDATEEIARRFPVEVLFIPPSGKAAALNCAMEHATGEILFFTDVRQTLSPNSLADLVSCFGDPEVGAASGELIIREGATQAEANVGLYWRYEKWIRKSLSRIDSVLGATGAIYAMRASLAKPMPRDAILDDVILPLGAFFAGYRVILDEKARAYDEPASLHTEFRRKIRTLAGAYQLIGVYPQLLGPGNRMWLHFMSHKFGRLLLPWALIVVAVSSSWLPAPWAAAALSMQAAFYLTALLDMWVPEHWPLKRLTSPVRTFVVLMIASACAVAIAFIPARSLWRDARRG